MRWVKYQVVDGKQIYARIDDDDIIRVTCIEEHPPLQEWLAQGNVAEEFE